MVHKKAAFSFVLLPLNWFTLEILTYCNFHSSLFEALKSFCSKLSMICDPSLQRNYQELSNLS